MGEASFLCIIHLVSVLLLVGVEDFGDSRGFFVMTAFLGARLVLGFICVAVSIVVVDAGVFVGRRVYASHDELELQFQKNRRKNLKGGK